MGGAAGHIRHVWEADELTFQQMKDIVNKATRGELDNVLEKLDGQNIMVSYREGKVIVARSSKHLKNYGRDALDIKRFSEYWADKPTPKIIKECFMNAAKDFQRFFDFFKEDLNPVFMDGKVWMNIEILCPHTENVIPYAVNQLKIHHLRELDENGKVVGILPENVLDSVLDKAVNFQFLDNLKFFLIRKTNKVNIKVSEKARDIYSKVIGIIDLYRDSFHMTDENTLGEYKISAFKHIIEANLNQDTEFVKTLSRRWGVADKTVPINVLLKGKDDATIEWVRRMEENHKSVYTQVMTPFMEAFGILGVYVLKNVEGIASADPDEAVTKIMTKLNESLDKAWESRKTEDEASYKEIINDVVQQLQWFNKLGGPDSIVPIEGIVFQYDGKLFKLTGSFTYILKIIGRTKFCSNENS